MGRRTGTGRTVVTTVGYLGGRLLQDQPFWCVRPAVLIAASLAVPLRPLPASCPPGQPPPLLSSEQLCVRACDQD